MQRLIAARNSKEARSAYSAMPGCFLTTYCVQRIDVCVRSYHASAHPRIRSWGGYASSHAHKVVVSAKDMKSG